MNDLNIINFDENESLNKNKFPTSGLKSLLQNSDLLELLLKPLGSNKSDEPSESLSSSSSSSSLTSNNTNVNNPVFQATTTATVTSQSPSSASNISQNTGLQLNDLLLDTQLDNLPDINLLDDNLTGKEKSIFDWKDSDEYFEMKANKIANSDGDNSKIYGNAFLGPNLWDKNDLFQGDKFGVKFEYLEIDEFLNENGLNETDVEFLDQLQKPDATVAPLNQINNGAQAATATNTNVQSKPALSPSVSSPSATSTSSSSSTSSSPSSSSNNNPIDMAVKSSNNSTNSNKSVSSSASKSNPMSIISQTHNYSTPPLNFKFQHQQSKESLNENLLSSSSSSANNFKSSMNDSSFDWNSNSNDVSIGSINDFDDFDPKCRKFSDEDLRPLPILRKSKKQFVPSEMKDDKYWARRKKNNIAAKRSRDARRVKENQIAIRASYLEKENDFLKKQLEDCKRETKLLKLKLAKYESTDLDHLSSK